MIEPNDSLEFIYWLFDGQCVGLEEDCWNRGTDRSHIVPVSRGICAKHWKNVVLHCRECHGKFHQMGASEYNIKLLQEVRTLNLLALGREEYI